MKHSSANVVFFSHHKHVAFSIPLYALPNASMSTSSTLHMYLGFRVSLRLSNKSNKPLDTFRCSLEDIYS